jgi:hypothetical protein
MMMWLRLLLLKENLHPSLPIFALINAFKGDIVFSNR